MRKTLSIIGVEPAMLTHNATLHFMPLRFFISTFHRSLSFLLVFLVSLAAGTEPLYAQNAPPGDTTAMEPSPDALIRQMVGTWKVQNRMWTGPDAEPITLPPAVVERRLIGGVFLEEIMTLAPDSDGEPFTRIAYFSYNDVHGRYEYFSLDTRAPQMMYETSYAGSGPDVGREHNTISLYDDSFVLRQWGSFTNTAFKLRAEIEVDKDRQVLRLYFTPLSGENAEEFLAMDYVYTRAE